MSIASRNNIAARISEATESSPLALFSTPDGIDCLFADTFVAQQRIAGKDHTGGTYLATVHRDSDSAMIRELLRTFCK